MKALYRGTMTVTAALVAAVMLYVGFTLPRRPIELGELAPGQVSHGAYHVHTTRSDGTGSIEDVARAAARAGLDWVIVTDHGDATRQADPPVYLQGVLIIDAAEISTSSGHVVALGLNEGSPYPLAGRAEDVIEDIHRQDGWAIAAHPDSPNDALRWSTGGVAFDGIEWLNADSEWRDEALSTLAGATVRSMFRPAETVVSLFSRPDRTFERWDRASRQRPVVAIAAVDAHGGLSSGDGGSPGLSAVVPVPGYRTMFSTMAQAIPLAEPLTGDADADAGVVLAGVMSGRTYTVIRALAWPATLEFDAVTADGSVVAMGQSMPVTETSVTFRARVPEAPGVTVDLLKDGSSIASGRGLVEHVAPAEVGVFRVEVRFPEAGLPWIVSNPIYVRLPPALEPEQAMPAVSTQIVQLPADERWQVERDASSGGTVSAVDGILRFDYQLGSGEPAGQYAALSVPAPANAGSDHIRFVAQASQPMRLSVQLRLPGGRDGLRWSRSVYVGTEPTAIVVRLSELEAVGGVRSQQPLVASVESILLVVDTVNARPGDSGTLLISEVGLGVGAVEAGGG